MATKFRGLIVYTGTVAAFLRAILTDRDLSELFKEQERTEEWAKARSKLGSAQVSRLSEKDEIRWASERFVRHIAFELRDATILPGGRDGVLVGVRKN